MEVGVRDVNWRLVGDWTTGSAKKKKKISYSFISLHSSFWSHILSYMQILMCKMT